MWQEPKFPGQIAHNLQVLELLKYIHMSFFLIYDQKFSLKKSTLCFVFINLSCSHKAIFFRSTTGVEVVAQGTNKRCKAYMDQALADIHSFI